MATYAVVTTGEDLSHNYMGIATWEFDGAGPSGDREYVEMYQVETERPTALESLLDTDGAVVSYYEVSKD